MAALLVEAGAAARRLNLVNGDPGPWARRCWTIRRCRKIRFTGSIRVGKMLMDGASRTVTRLSLELGGNAPVLVFPDVDLEQVTAGAVTRQVPQRRPGVRLAAAVPGPARRGDGVRREDRRRASASSGSGSGLDAGRQVGPLINARQRDRVEAMVAGARARGVHVRGRRAAPARQAAQGYFYEPTVVTDVAPDMPVFHEEIFGPVLPVSTFDGHGRGDRAGQPTRYGLAAYVWTNHLPPAMRAAERLEFGMVGVNEWAAARGRGDRSPAGKKAAWDASRAPKASTNTWRPSWSRSAVCRDERARASAG